MDSVVGSFAQVKKTYRKVIGCVLLFCFLAIGSAAGLFVHMHKAMPVESPKTTSSPQSNTSKQQHPSVGSGVKPSPSHTTATGPKKGQLSLGGIPIALPPPVANVPGQNAPSVTPAPLPLPTIVPIPAYPNVANTGVPRNLSITATAFNFLGEGLTDTRQVEALVKATPANTGMSAPDSQGVAYLPNAAIDIAFDHMDFTNLVLVVPSAVHSITFTKCLFQTTDPSLSANRARGAFLVQVLGASTTVTLIDNSLSGATPDPHFAVQNFLSTPIGNNTAGGVTFLRNNITGFSTALSLGAFENFLYDSNYVHDLVINKSNDVSPYTNSGVWAHIDGFQIGYTNYVGSGKVRNNNLIAWSASNQISSGPLQVGQMAGPGTARITSFIFDGNYLDGGSYMVGANTNTPISVTQNFEFTNNKFGLNYAYGADGANTIHGLSTLWAGNTFYKTGVAQTNRPIYVTAGQLIP